MQQTDQTNYRLDLEYDGTNFSGWQVQDNERTVQGVIEDTLNRLFVRCSRVGAAGRTDAGVHASGQVAHFQASPFREPETVRSALNANLPHDVRIHAVSVVDASFHSRFSAKWRGYRYRIALKPIAIGRDYCWICQHRISHFNAMQQAAHIILGNHRFRGFAHESANESHYLSTVFRSEWISDGVNLDYQIEANRFLHGMVRFLVGTMVNVGRGKTAITDMHDLLRSEDVTKAGPKAPASGLTLTSVGYRPWPDV